MKTRLWIISALLGFLTAFAISCAPDLKGDGKKDDPTGKVDRSAKPYVVLVSIDGYRHDYTEKYHPPTISAIANEGVQAESMKPSYPSLTFPNHYTLITGLLPAHHGIVSNFFYDNQWNLARSFLSRHVIRHTLLGRLGSKLKAPELIIIYLGRRKSVTKHGSIK
jgi:predicted AlkP superfamily pyrophosphatase or phosphodiesterase